MKTIRFDRFATLGLVGAACFCGWLALAQIQPSAPGSEKTPGASGPRLELRMGLEQLRNPFWYEQHGQPHEAKDFWDKGYWDRALNQWAQDGYNALLYWIEPWNQTSWQALLIRHKEFPEARELTGEQVEKIIAHVNWIFQRAHELGLKNFLFTYHVATTVPFAKAHGFAKELPLSESVDMRHNAKGEMGAAWGVRNEATRAFTEAATAELFQTYKDLDGINGGMGEALPGKRSTWYREAVAPGLKRSGRKPISLVMNWFMPLEDFLADGASPAVYDNTWLSVMSNVEMMTDAKPYPYAIRWAEKSGLPTIFEIVHHNHEANFPVNSPRLAYEMVREYKKVENCKGFLAWFLRSDVNKDLLRKALGYYGKTDEPYSDAPWLAILEKRFGDRKSAEHFLQAYDASARIPGELSALAWLPHDIGDSRQLMLPYRYWTDDEPRWNYLASPVRAGVLLPVRPYAQAVARLGPSFRDNNGAVRDRNKDHPGSQDPFWILGDYPTTPEAHMRNIRRLGAACLEHAEQALQTAKTNKEEARAIYNYMKAYKLLSDYYERKVLAAVAALIHGFGGGLSYRAEAEKLADETVTLYTTAIQFIWEEIDRKSGGIKGRGNAKEYTLPELIEHETQERAQLAKLFRWAAK
jgi:hypothetical protein